MLDDFVWVMYSSNNIFYDVSPTESEVFPNATNQTSNYIDKYRKSGRNCYEERPKLHEDLLGLKRVELIYGGKTSLKIKFLNQNGRIIFECREKTFMSCAISGGHI